MLFVALLCVNVIFLINIQNENGNNQMLHQTQPQQ